MKQHLPVYRLYAGESGIITEVRADTGNTRRKLAAFGIMPGVKLKVLQTVPAYVLEIGYTQVAVDTELAAVIFVRKDFSAE